jgi:hypothetical protein
MDTYVCIHSYQDADAFLTGQRLFDKQRETVNSIKDDISLAYNYYLFLVGF